MERIVEDGKPKLLVGWIEYQRMVLRLGQMYVDKEGHPPTCLIYMPRGANTGVTILSVHFNDIPTIVFPMHKYDDAGNKLPKEQQFAGRKLVKLGPKEWGPHALVFDDVTESGETQFDTKALMNRVYRTTFQTVKYGVVFHKETSELFTPDYFVQTIPKEPNGTCPWIVHPWSRSPPPEGP